MRLDVGLPTEIVTAGSDSNVSVCIRLGVEAIQRNCYNNNNETVGISDSCNYNCISIKHYLFMHIVHALPDSVYN